MQKTKEGRKKPIIMYALYSSGVSERPKGLFHSKWKAKEALRYLWNTPDDWHIERVLVEQQGLTHFDIYKHEVKRI